MVVWRAIPFLVLCVVPGVSLQAGGPPLSTLKPIVPEWARPDVVDPDAEGRDAYRTAVTGILETARLPGRTGLEDARAHRLRAAGLFPDDPRHDHALALVLVRKLQQAEAVETFEEVAGRPGEPYLPAWLALIHLHARRSDDVALFRTATELATRVIEDESLDDDSRSAVALWLGRAAAGSKFCATTARRPAVFEAEAQLRTLWPEGELRNSYDVGRSHAAEERARLTAEADELQAAAQRQRDRLDALEASAVASERVQLRDRADDLKEELLSETDPLVEHMRRIREEVQYLEQRMQSLAESIRLARTEQLRIVAIYQLARGDVPGFELLDRRQRVVLRAELNGVDDQFAALVQRLQTYLSEYVATAQRRSAMLATAAMTQRRYAGHAIRFETEHDRLTSRGVALWKQEARSANMRDRHLARDRSNRRAASLRRTARTLITYVPFDFDHELQLLAGTIHDPPDAGEMP